MEYGKRVGIALLVGMALVGLLSGYGQVKAAYADWTFLRNLRVAAEVRAAQQQAQQQQAAAQRAAQQNAAKAAPAAEPEAK